MTEDNSIADLSYVQIVFLVLFYWYFLLLVQVVVSTILGQNPGPPDGSTTNAKMQSMRSGNASPSSIGTIRVKSSEKQSHGNPRSRSTKSTTKEKANCVDSRAPKNHRDHKDKSVRFILDKSGTTKSQSSRENRTLRKTSAQRIQTKEEDQKFAQSIHLQENLMHKVAQERSHQAMMTSNIGKAILLVERIIQCVEALKDKCKIGLGPVAKDDMVILAERLFAKQNEFKAKGIPTRVDIGFHYTTEENMHEIQVNGLMTKKDRIKKKIDVKTNGAVFGDGVYTANNPTSFKRYGSVGLIVARMQGKTTRIAERLDRTKHPKIPNTIIGDKNAKSLEEWRPYDHWHEIILQESSQCLPLIRYDKKLLFELSLKDQDAHMAIIIKSLNEIIGELFNGTKRSHVVETADEVEIPTNEAVETTKRWWSFLFPFFSSR